MTAYTAPALSTLRQVVQQSTHPAVTTFSSTESSETLPHATLRCRVAAFARALAASIPPTSPVAIVIPNSPHFILSFLATTAANLIAAPLNAAYTAEEYSFYLSDAAIHTVLLRQDIPSDAPIRAAASALGLAVQHVPDELLAPSTPDEEASTSESDLQAFPADPAYTPSPSSTALFLHTSGTTSRPKGVPLTHANLVTSIRNIAATYELSPSDRCLLVMPLFHVHGLMAATLTTLSTGGAVLLPPGGKFSASAFWPCLQAGGATWYTAVPTIHQILLSRADADYPAHAPPKLRFIRSCSASLAPAVLMRLEERFGAPVLEAYAMTEAAHQMTSNPLPKFGERKPGSVGVAQGVQVGILDERNEVVSAGKVGEVCIRGDNVTKGYQNNAVANETAFAGGWFHTGDQGSLDENGYLTLTGRIKELVNRGGEKISPLEVDAALLAHAGVKEAVSFAVPDDKYGEEVNAAVIWKDGYEGSVEELKEFAKGKLASFKIPKRFFVSDDLPRTATGKIQRRIVSKHFLDKLAGGEQ